MTWQPRISITTKISENINKYYKSFDTEKAQNASLMDYLTLRVILHGKVGVFLRWDGSWSYS